MKKCKKVIAAFAALLIVSRVVLMGVSAAMVGAGAMLGIIAVLAAALVYSGTYTQAQVDNMSNSEIIWSVKNGLNNGSIDPKKNFPNPDGNVIGGLSTAALIDWLTNNDYYENWKDGVDIIENAIDDWFRDFFNDYEKLSDNYVKPTFVSSVWPYPSQGFGALMVRVDKATEKEVELFYCDYIVICTYWDYYPCYDTNSYSGSSEFWRQDRYTNYELEFYHNYSTSNIDLGKSSIAYNAQSSERENLDYYCYGDVRYEDGTQAIEEEYEYLLGETEDGAQVTVDMLNPDGTVTVDGVTYDPSEYINIDYYTDPAVIDLLQRILDALDNANVVAPDITYEFIQDIIGDTELEISSELADYTIPQMIATVFPFCIPVDFVRGMKLLLEEPEVPVFKAELDLTNICGYDLGKQEIEVSFEKWEPAAKICRWFFTFMFGYVLIFLTFKIVKGV